MKKSLIFGTSRIVAMKLKQVFGDEQGLSNRGIIGFVDNVKLRNTFLGLPVFLPEEVKTSEFDNIVIVSASDPQGVYYRLVHEYGIQHDKIAPEKYLANIKIISDYYNGKIQDAETVQTVHQLETLNNFDIWCGYCPKPREKYEVIWDEECNMPYVIYESKKMYYPREWPPEANMNVIDGKEYVIGVEFEQQPGSPHTYITDDIYVKEGDVVVDAGVCEGNFAIKYIDKVSKLYLIECDPLWVEALKMTFRDYMDKVVICQKFLGGTNNDKTITLDKLIVNDRVDFIKMDIEGAEIDALKGAKNVFLNNDIRCSICSYHKHDDEKNIREILGSYGYSTGTSNGHMIFPLDKEFFKWCELRHGIVYGKKGEFQAPK